MIKLLSTFSLTMRPNFRCSQLELDYWVKMVSDFKRGHGIDATTFQSNDDEENEQVEKIKRDYCICQ